MVPSGSGVRISLVLFSFFPFYGFGCILYSFLLNLKRLAISKSGDNDDGSEWNKKDGHRVSAYLCSLLEGIPYFQLPIDICYLFFFYMDNTRFSAGHVPQSGDETFHSGHPVNCMVDIALA